MNKQEANNLIIKTFENPFDESRFRYFIKNLLNNLDESKQFEYHGQFIPASFRDAVKQYKRLGQYKDPNKNTIDILTVNLKRETTLERARTLQRNFIAWYLRQKNREAALVAYCTDEYEDWRFSLVKLDFNLNKAKIEIEFSPAKRFSFLVGANERSHTAQTQFQKILTSNQSPTLDELQQAFNIETVTREFFLEYRNLFIRTKVELDKIIKSDPKVNKEFDSKYVNSVDFSKKLLGQIIFLYFLQKKGWFGVERDSDWGTGSKKFLRELFEKKHGNYKNFFNDILEPLFYSALRIDRSHDDHYYDRFNCKIPFLNGGLFDPIGYYDWVHTDINLPNELFSNNHKTKENDTGDGILDIFDRYNFTVIEDEPLEKEVAIDPELLGKTYEKFNAIRPDNFNEYNKVLEKGNKGEENKFNRQYGVYYTPREIVHYMCRESLINYLASVFDSKPNSFEKLGETQLDILGNISRKGQLSLETENVSVLHIPKKDIETLINYGELLGENEAIVESKGKETDTYYYKLPESIRKNAKLIDDKLTELLVCDPAVGSGAFPVGMMHEIVSSRNILSIFIKDKCRTIYKFKRDCIEKSLYGVDIDSGAVEIAKLRLWLSLVVDENDFREIKPLPNLDYKIVRGNSLIGFPENWRSEIAEKIESLKREYFVETRPQNKKVLKDEIDRQIKSRLENSEKNFGYSVDFDFRTFFSEVFHLKNGFDIVIANPPYIQLQKMKTDADILQKVGFKTYARTGDIYCLFYEKGINLLKSKGILAYITSNKWMRAAYGEKLRKYFISYSNPIQLIDFGGYQVFEATVDTNIMITEKAPFQNKVNTCVLSKDLSLNNMSDYFRQNSRTTFFDLERSWVVLSSVEQRIKKKIEAAGTPLKELDIKIYRGILTGYNEAFIINQETRDILIEDSPKNAEIIRPILRGRDIQKYKVDWDNLYIIGTFPSLNINIDEYPAIKKYLLQFGINRLKQAGGKGARKKTNNKWFETQDSINYWEDFFRPKIVWGEISDKSKFAYDEGIFFIEATSFIMTGKNLKYLIGMLNSKLLEWYFTNYIGTATGVGTNRWKKYTIGLLPIKLPSEKELQLMESLVNQVVSKDNSSLSTNDSENKINELVYALYNLTDHEIKYLKE